MRVAHAPGMLGTFPSPPRVSDPDMHHSTCVTHVPWCMPGSLTSCFLWSRWWGKRCWHSWHMHNPQFYVSGKKPMVTGHTQSYHMVVIRPVAVIPTGTSLIPYICHNRSQNIIFRENDIDCLAQLGVHAQFLLSRELFTTVPVGEAAMRAFLQNVIT